MDNATINYVEDYVNIGLPRVTAAILLIEVDGHPAQVADEAVSVKGPQGFAGALWKFMSPRTPLRKEHASGKPTPPRGRSRPAAVPR